MTGSYLDEFIDAWEEIDVVYRDLVEDSLWPREMRDWQSRRQAHERARKDTAATREAFEAAAGQWRREAGALRGELERLRGSTPEHRARLLDPWLTVRAADPSRGMDEHETSPLWPGWRDRLWRRSLDSDWELPMPLLPSEVREAEEQLGVRLPKEYRRFLLEVAAGIPGGMPMSIAPLVRDAAGRWMWAEIGTRTSLSRLAEVFPARQADVMPDDQPRRDDFASEEAYLVELDKWENEEPPYDGDPRDELTRGALCLHSLGCGDALWLVISGPAAGQLWADYLEHEAGFYPHRTRRGGAPMTFQAWIRDAFRCTPPRRST
ncbi:SMI1/KNR4 family protein [Nonomuraea fuscirosea]|uniref:SMI1/KNR4 family protein n=1 Tax=Nonomuraea fuscirosea TaxID=1291556 RepID=UPI002DDC4E3F|nr:SMI1/KNR4 family protein [Nonomuraea fuscirosea]WSA48367.1 SMI1/KNR4 family protein [Nonomuraea fuscirosea]